MTPEKQRILHVARRQLGLTEDDYRAVLKRCAGVESSRDLCLRGFNAVMDHFKRLGFKSTSKRKPMAARAGMAAPGQVQMIRGLWADYTEGQGTDATLGKWLERTFHVSALAFVSAEVAPKAIKALRVMAAKKAARPAPQPEHAA